ncbi:MAG: T9SS type A sorting domain-containing protein [Bacteroidetes bacterium]|nr:T9SS type A sorting domain-containing protein [Bacteroidota bacterium]
MKTIYTACINRVLRLRIALLFLVATVFTANDTFASHMAGADLTYEYIGNGQYLVTFTLYRDCFGIPAPTTESLTLSSATCNNFSQFFTLDAVPGTGQEITYTCDGTLTTCNGGTAPGIQEWQYQTIVTVPAQCPDWVFSVSDCCRNQAITTIANASGDNLYIEAYLNNTIFDNNSPTFSNVPIAFECIGQNNFYNHGVIDADGDSLVYFFIPPRNGPNDPLAYNPTYTIANPITSIPAVSINQQTGDIAMHPTQSEIGVIAILVQEWRNGVLIGSVMRDMQIYTVQCNNTLPSATGINGTTDFTTTSCIGGQLCFDVISADTDPNDTLTMTWNQAIAGATFTTTAGPRPVGHFCWAPTPADARPQPYTFTVTVRDNACPSNGVQTYSYSITVSNMSVAVTSTPSVACHGDHNGSASGTATGNLPLSYVWTTPSGELFTPSISHLSAGNYSVNITDANGCVGTEYFTIAEPAPISLTLSSVDAGCGSLFGEASVAAAGGTGAYSYLWNDANAQTTATATALTTGNYSVVVTDANGCHAGGSVDVLGGLPVSATISSTPATCVANDGSVTVVVTGGSGDFNFAWTPNVSSTSSASNLTAGAYDVVVTDNQTGCIINLTSIVNNSSGITASITGATDATCQNGEDGTACVVGSGGIAPYTYDWMPNGDTTDCVSNLSPGTYTVRVTDYTGCSAYASVTIGYINASPAVELGPDTVGCIGTTITLDAGAGYASYLWSDNSTGQTLDVSADGIYSVLVTNAAGCENFDAVNVTFISCQTQRPVIHHANNTQSFTLSPNPAHGNVVIGIAKIRNTDVTVTISDIIGNKVFMSKETADYNFNKTIDIHELPAGVYMVKVEYADQVTTTRLIKE